jgi:hypothetical protein
MYVYDCKHCYLTKTLDVDLNIKKCIRCGCDLEKPKKATKKTVFNFPSNVRKYSETREILV